MGERGDGVDRGCRVTEVTGVTKVKAVTGVCG